MSMLNAPIRDLSLPRAQLRAPFGVPLVNAAVPAWSVQEFLGLARIKLGFTAAAVTVNRHIREGRVPGGFIDKDGRPAVEIDRTTAAIDYLERRFG